MGKTLLALLVIVSLIGCGRTYETVHKWENNCTSETVEARSLFILQCIANANPKSDEEPEDWIRKCQFMAEDTYCKKEEFAITYSSATGSGIWKEVRRILVVQEAAQPDGE